MIGSSMTLTESGCMRDMSLPSNATIAWVFCIKQDTVDTGNYVQSTLHVGQNKQCTD